jgi:peptide/nickel transport system ATP-binding protein
MEPLLSVNGLRVHFATRNGTVRAVDDLSFDLCAGETLAIVGESGCGKSVTSLSLLRLLDEPPAKVAGEIVFEGRNLLSLDEREMRKIRGNEISMVFQEPMTSLNPLLTIARQLIEPIILHRNIRFREARERAVELLRLVGIASPEQRMSEYPHQLSGGMRQRVMIAIAIACNPKLLIADEPTTALDVTIQAQILDLMRSLQAKIGSAIILITHDLGVVADAAQRVIVMYAGRKVEDASVEDIFERPGHPYTKGLLGAIPNLGSSASEQQDDARLTEIPGAVPSLISPQVGCSFSNRCINVQEVCRRAAPALREVGSNHWSACHFAAVLG